MGSDSQIQELPLAPYILLPLPAISFSQTMDIRKHVAKCRIFLNIYSILKQGLTSLKKDDMGVIEQSQWLLLKASFHYDTNCNNELRIHFNQNGFTSTQLLKVNHVQLNFKIFFLLLQQLVVKSGKRDLHCKEKKYNSRSTQEDDKDDNLIKICFELWSTHCLPECPPSIHQISKKAES